jgi:hypothetical protein
VEKTVALFLLLLVFAIPASASENMMPSADAYVFSDGWIYYRAVSGEDYALCRVRADLTGAEKLLDVSAYHLSVAGDTLYFLADGEIHQVSTDGKRHKALVKAGDWDGPLIATGDYMYLRGDDKILRYRTNHWKKVGTIPARKPDVSFEIVDGWIYLAGSDDTARSARTFYRACTDGTGRERWYEAPGPGSLTMWTISDGMLYYGLEDSTSGTAQLRRVNLDGTGDKLLLEGLWTRWIHDGWAYGTKFLSEPEVTTAEDSFDGVETRTYETRGVYRVNLKTAESQFIGDYDVFILQPVGDLIVIDEEDAWSGTASMVMQADGTNVRPMPRPSP